MKVATQRLQNLMPKIRHSRPAGLLSGYRACCTDMKTSVQNYKPTKSQNMLGAAGDGNRKTPMGSLARQSSLMASSAFTERLPQK